LTLYHSQSDPSLTFLHTGFDPGVGCLTDIALSQWLLGYPTQAVQKIQEMMELAQQLSHPPSTAIALGWAAMLYQMRRESQHVQERTEAAIAFTAEHGVIEWLAMCTLLHGWALVQNGQAEEGLQQLRQGLADWRATGAVYIQPYFLALLAESLEKVGQAEEGLQVIEEALTMADEHGERVYEAELYRLKGELVLNAERRMMNTERQTGKETAVQARVQEVEQYFHTAIDIARHQEAKSWELRAASSLARLWKQQGKTTEARDLLTPVYDWFTEGFDTADLKDAQALLDTLSEDM
jgi:predicted ATPase